MQPSLRKIGNRDQGLGIGSCVRQAGRRTEHVHIVQSGSRSMMDLGAANAGEKRRLSLLAWSLDSFYILSLYVDLTKGCAAPLIVQDE
eukprot:scaffold1682_cov154-Skeletonema_marinoi.AAC.16